LRKAIFALVVLGLALPAAAATKAAPYKPSEATLEVYKVKCQACHMADGNSPLEPLNFADGTWKHGSSVKEIATVISEGVPGSAMLPFKTQIEPADVEALARYVRSFDKKPLAPAKATKSAKPPAKPASE
jgi:mono/diheme cytochrome c family protein